MPQTNAQRRRNRRYRAEQITPGRIEVVDKRTKFTGLYHNDGTYHSGACELPAAFVLALVAR